jgi:hypothetical protein
MFHAAALNALVESLRLARLKGAFGGEHKRNVESF